MIKLYAAKITTMCIKTHLLLITLLLLSVSGFADERQHMEPVSLEERTQNSDIIIEGEVISQKSFWDSRHENIYTSNIIRVYKVFKGEVKAEEIELITKGGTVGLKMHVHSTALELDKGEQGIFFLNKNQPIQNTPGGQRLKTRAYAGPQGFIDYNLTGGPVKDVFNEYSSVQDIYRKIKSITNTQIRVISENEKLKKNANNSQTQEQSSLAIPVITSFSPTLATAGTRTVLTINGTGFGATRGNGMVQFLDAQRGGRDKTGLLFMTPLPSHYISWSNTQIKLYIPSIGVDRGVAGTGPIRVTSNDGTSITTSQELVIEYVYSNLSFENKPFQPKLINDNGQGGYTIQLAPSIQNRAAAREGFLRALNSWVCATEVNWEIGSPSTSETTAEDNRNIIRFVAPSDLGEMVLASTISRYEGCASSSDTLFYLSEFDMQINNSINWQYGPAPPAPSSRQFDFETVMLHELGHAHQLGHVILPRAVMHYAIAFEQLFRDLSAADVRGGTFVLANSTGTSVCRQSPMVPEPEGDCDLAPEIFTLSAAFQAQRVLVSWQTNEELAVDFFVVQRSENSNDWSDIATVDAKGPSTGTLDYTYTDANPLPDISYYRIKVVYVDGASRLSPRVRVLDPASLRVLRIYPNPIPPERHSVRLLYLVNASTTMTVHLYDTTGKLVREYTIELTDVNTPVDLPLQGLASGMYIARWQEKINSGEFKIIRL
ncbi:T9SS type A sorting domain-containing protein [Pontibacter locisalis]|uniref:T9SS type A sorting domain-containing protein n=1 Tax=Pontibacter locisalis TaxID=1719035 RepID=A0ABW5ILD1_9BACT